jgi:DNA modification methylase
MTLIPPIPSMTRLMASVVTKPGDLWLLGDHRILCGDARSEPDLNRLMGDRRAAAAFLDPPYNVSIKGVVGRGRRKHGEFAMASGEMSRGEFVSFLTETLGNATTYSREGAVHYVCMDWRHLGELIEAGEIYSEMLNLAVWVKSNAGQGSFTVRSTN